ncbi:MAG: DNA double-strand break repair nuclease NurA, partial [Blastocatellia bacterium]
MLIRQQLLDCLTRKRDQFTSWDREFLGEIDQYRRALRELAALSRLEIDQRLGDHAAPGALLTEEFDASPHLRQQFPHIFRNHEEARAWAHQILLGRATFAADGSQIPPSADVSIPVAAVQVASFINHHTADGHYSKTAWFDALAPDELLVEMNGEQVISDQAVNLRRFEMEIETLRQSIETLAVARDTLTRTPVGFFDNSLVISFAERLSPPLRDRHVELVLDVMRTAERHRIPLIGYVDGSRARDFTNMLAHCFALAPAEKLHDAELLGARLAWGDRTPLFVCARGGAGPKEAGVLEQYAEYRRRMGFLYLRSGAAAPPARLDIPLWVYEQGLLEDVVDTVRAEIVVGNGYPYVIETADAAAV